MTRRISPALREAAAVAFVVCETSAAITPHIRSTAEVPATERTLSGFAARPKALCGAEVAWDTRLPLSAARCCYCIAALEKSP